MSVGSNAFRLLLCVGWAILLIVSIHAVRSMGVNAAGGFFIGDFAQPWRAQFNTDLALHLLLVAAWMIYRSRTWMIGLICGFLAINLGGVFTLAYLLVASIQAQGDIRKMLLGSRVPASLV